MRLAFRWTLALLLAALGALALTSPSSALAGVDDVAAELRTSPLYNDPASESALTSSQESDLLAQMGTAPTPIYIAVVPSSFVADNGGTPRAALTNLANAVGRDGTYALVAGRSFWAASNTVQGVSGIATEAINANRGGSAYDVLSTFVTGVSSAPDLSSDSSTSTGSSGSSSEGGFPWGWVIVGGGLLGIAGAGSYSIRKSRRREAEQLAGVKKVVDEDVTTFGEEVAAFDITDPRLDDAGRADLQTAIESYRQASDASSRMTKASEASAATFHLEDGRYAMACVRARLEGRPLPDRRAPCFFDPRHGPSVNDVTWSPPGGQARDVPACAACSTTVAHGQLPASREVPVGSDMRPYWQAGPTYGSYAGGYFGSFGSVLPSILVGTMLGNALFPPTVISDTSAIDSGGFGGGDSGGFGGFGGGGFGGGDFGGDIGGGDFGGGDF